MIARDEDGWRGNWKAARGKHTIEFLEDTLNGTGASTTAHGNVEFVGVRHVSDL